MWMQRLFLIPDCLWSCLPARLATTSCRRLCAENCPSPHGHGPQCSASMTSRRRWPQKWRKTYPVMKADLEHYKKRKDSRGPVACRVANHTALPRCKAYVNARSGRRTPIQKIDNYRDNGLVLRSRLGSRATQLCKGLRQEPRKRAIQHAGLSAVPIFRTDQCGKIGMENTLRAGKSSGLSAEQTLKWAKEDPNDPRIPEALHYAVRSTRYSCEGAKTSKLSRQAFKLLHSRYPNPGGAKETPFWF